MIDVTPELLSLYADHQATPDQALRIEAAVAADPVLAAQLEELVDLGEMFAPAEAPEVSAELKQRLYALGRTRALEQFKAVRVEAGSRPGRGPWAARVAALAAVLLIGIGLRQLLYRPEVIVTEFARQVLDPAGRVASTQRLERVLMRAGDPLVARAGERISCRLPGGARVVLLPGGRLRLGDPREREMFELVDGMALCTVAEREQPRQVRAAGYVIRADRAHFGLRVRDAGARAAGVALAGSDGAVVTIAVSRGSLQVSDRTTRETVRAGARIVLRAGAPVERSQVWKDPLYVYLLRNFRAVGREILPGYFTVEQGVTPIAARRWVRRPDGSRALVLTGNEGAALAHYLVLQVRASRPTPLLLTRVRPYRDAPGLAETVTVQTATVGTAWTVIAVPRRVFDHPAAGQQVLRQDRKIPAGQSRLMRLELRPASNQSDRSFEVKASLWAPRPPTDLSEEIR